MRYDSKANTKNLSGFIFIAAPLKKNMNKSFNFFLKKA